MVKSNIEKWNHLDLSYASLFRISSGFFIYSYDRPRSCNRFSVIVDLFILLVVNKFLSLVALETEITKIRLNTFSTSKNDAPMLLMKINISISFGSATNIFPLKTHYTFNFSRK